MQRIVDTVDSVVREQHHQEEEAVSPRLQFKVLCQVKSDHVMLSGVMPCPGAEDVHGLHGLRLVPAAGGGRGHAGAGHGRGRVEADGAAQQHPEVRLLMSCHAMSCHAMSCHVMS